MIRLILYLVLAGGFAIIVSWFAEQTGQTTIIWLDTEVSLPTSLAIGGMIGLFVVAGFCAWLFRKFLSWPGLIAYNWRERRRRDGEKALAIGMVAFAAGDIKRARRQAKKSEKLLGSGILPDLLSAQTAHATGDTKASLRYFQALAKDRQTAYFGQIGLMRLYHQAGNDSDSIEAAEQALLIEKNSLPAIMKLLADALANQAWEEAHARVDRLIALRQAEQKHQPSDRLFSDNPQADNAVMPSGQLANLPLLAAYLCLFIAELQADDRAKLKWLTLAADYPAPLPAAILKCAGLEAEQKPKSAIKRLEAGFIRLPHSRIADQLKQISGTNDGQHVAQIGKLAEKTQNRDEAQLIVAEQALACGIWAAASAALSQISAAGYTNRYYMVSARLADAMSGTDAETQTLSREDALFEAATAPHGSGWYCAGCHAPHPDMADSCSQCGVIGQIGWMPAHSQSVSAPILPDRT